MRYIFPIQLDGLAKEGRRHGYNAKREINYSFRREQIRLPPGTGIAIVTNTVHVFP